MVARHLHRRLCAAALLIHAVLDVEDDEGELVKALFADGGEEDLGVVAVALAGVMPRGGACSGK